MKPHTRISERHSNTALLALTTAVLILVLAGVLFAAELDAPAHSAVSPAAPTTPTTGWLHTLYDDGLRGGIASAVWRTPIDLHGVTA